MTTCTPENGKFVENGTWVPTCTSKVYNEETRECLANTKSCAFYKSTARGYACVGACETLSYNGECMKTCPGVAPYEEAGKCVSACASGVINNRTCIFTVGNCQHYREVNGSLVCDSACAEGELELGTRCVTACPTGMFVDVAGKACVGSCGSGAQRFR